MNDIKCPSCGSEDIEIWDEYNSELDVVKGYWHRNSDWHCYACDKDFYTTEKYKIELQEIIFEE